MRWIWGGLLVLAAAPALAGITTQYDGSTPIAIRVKPGHIVQVTFPAGITGIYAPMPPNDIRLVIDETHAQRLRIETYAPPRTALVHVNTITGAQYLLRLTAATKQVDTVVHVVDAPQQAPPAAASPSPGPPPGGAATRGETVAPAPAVDPVRHIWLAQWGGDPRLAPRGVTMVALRETLLDSDQQRIEVIWAYRARGYYGFTERITNTSSQPLVLWLPGLYDPYARLWSASLDGHTPPLAPGEQPHVIAPGMSVLLHLVCVDTAP
jgi:hypothetical protein